MFQFTLHGLSEFQERTKGASRKLKVIFNEVFKQEKPHVKPLFKNHILTKYAAKPGAFKFFYVSAKRSQLKVEAGTFKLPVITYFPHTPKSTAPSTGSQQRLTSFEIEKGHIESEPRGFVWHKLLFFRPQNSTKSLPVIRRSGPSMFAMCMKVADPCIDQIVSKCQDEVDRRLYRIF